MAIRSESRAGNAQSSPTSTKSPRAKARNGGIDWVAVGAGGSIAHMLSESPGGLEGALKRLQAAKAAGKQPTIAIGLGEEPPGESLEQLDARTGYGGSIQGSTLQEALEEQREALFDAQAIVESVAKAFEADQPSMMYSRALRLAAARIDTTAGALEAGTLEDRAIAISRERDTGTAERG